MLFKIICFVVAGSAFIKGLTGIFAHDKLYGWARKHYASEEWSFTFILLLVYGIAVVGTTWYATIFTYVKYGWILTVFMSIMSLKMIGLIFNWKETSRKFVNLIESGGKKLWVLDFIVLVLGVIFLLMGLYLYN